MFTGSQLYAGSAESSHILIGYYIVQHFLRSPQKSCGFEHLTNFHMIISDYLLNY